MSLSKCELLEDWTLALLIYIFQYPANRYLILITGRRVRLIQEGTKRLGPEFKILLDWNKVKKVRVERGFQATTTSAK